MLLIASGSRNELRIERCMAARYMGMSAPQRILHEVDKGKGYGGEWSAYPPPYRGSNINLGVDGMDFAEKERFRHVVAKIF
jgi:hypothetical protein